MPAVATVAISARLNLPGRLRTPSPRKTHGTQNFDVDLPLFTLVSTLAGSAVTSGSADGTGSTARFNFPTSVALDSSGNAYVADFNNHTIRKVTPAGVVSTLAGSAGMPGSTDGTGSAARFNNPHGITVDSNGNAYVADYGNHTIRKITPAGVVTTLAGLAGSAGSADGTGSAARFSNPAGIGVDSGTNVYVADTGNQTIRKITSVAVVSTLAGLAGNAGSANGTGSAARFNSPFDVAPDASGNIYVADFGNDTIRKITSTAVVSTLAGAAGVAGSADGTGSSARFNGPTGVGVDSAGNIYVADFNNNTIRKSTPAGVVSTVAGLAGSGGSVDGPTGAARFNGPGDVAVDSGAKTYISDTNNHTVRLMTPSQTGIECRTGGASGNHQLLVTFPRPVTVGSVSATPDPNALPTATGTVSNSSVTGNQVAIALGNVSNAQTLTVTLSAVYDGTNISDVNIPMGVLLGDVNGSARVDSGDVSLVRQQTLQTITSSNFREDINVSNRIDSGDVSIVRQQTLTSLP